MPYGAPYDPVLAPGVGSERRARGEPVRERHCCPSIIGDDCVVVVQLVLDVSCPAAKGGPRVRRRDRRWGSRWPRCSAEAQAGNDDEGVESGGRTFSISIKTSSLDLSRTLSLSLMSPLLPPKKITARLLLEHRSLRRRPREGRCHRSTHSLRSRGRPALPRRAPRRRLGHGRRRRPRRLGRRRRHRPLLLPF